MKWVASWSGGKDSCLACYKALGEGKAVGFLLNMISAPFQRCSWHGITAELIRRQGEATGIPLIQQQFSPQANEYENAFKGALCGLRERGVGGLITGDIYLEEHRQWLVRLCDEVKMELLMPLWGMDVEEIPHKFIASGFEAIVVCVKADLLPPSFLGRKVDKNLISDLKRLNIDPCGERGEYHTAVVGGPLFTKNIVIRSTKQVLRDGHWFLDIEQYEVVEK